jgi:hypothetical protein
MHQRIKRKASDDPSRVEDVEAGSCYMEEYAESSATSEEMRSFSHLSGCNVSSWVMPPTVSRWWVLRAFQANRD